MSSPPPTSPPPMVWPGPPTVMPFPLPWGGTGCCPPGGMSALMQCYCDIQQASAFIGQVMIDQINNNPAVAEAIIAAIEKSGSNLPLIGVTNGADAQPGQVGEWVMLINQSIAYPTTPFSTSVSLGVLQPGDWDGQLALYSPDPLTGANILLNPLPQGFEGLFQSFLIGDASSSVIETPVFRINCSTPQLIVAEIFFNQAAPAPSAGTAQAWFTARRAR